jgi:hypothetical protein
MQLELDASLCPPHRDPFGSTARILTKRSGSLTVDVGLKSRLPPSSLSEWVSRLGGQMTVHLDHLHAELDVLDAH